MGTKNYNRTENLINESKPYKPSHNTTTNTSIQNQNTIGRLNNNDFGVSPIKGSFARDNNVRDPYKDFRDRDFTEMREKDSPLFDMGLGRGSINKNTKYDLDFKEKSAMKSVNLPDQSNNLESPMDKPRSYKMAGIQKIKFDNNDF